MDYADSNAISAQSPLRLRTCQTQSDSKKGGKIFEDNIRTLDSNQAALSSFNIKTQSPVIQIITQ